MGAQALVESTVFEGSVRTVYSADSKETGFAAVVDVLPASNSTSAPAGNLRTESLPYSYKVSGSANVKALVVGKAGQTLQFPSYRTGT